jgi:hypothetical protein
VKNGRTCDFARMPGSNRLAAVEILPASHPGVDMSYSETQQTLLVWGAHGSSGPRAAAEQN